MGHALAQVRLNRSSDLPEDVVVNTFHFSTPLPAVTIAEADSINTALQDFYLGPTGAAGTRVTDWLSVLLAAGTNAQVRVYDVSGLPPHPPLKTYTFAVGRATDDPLPGEVALCLSYEGSGAGSIRRRRGRVYLGPTNAAAGLAGGGIIAGDIRPPNLQLDAWVNAGQRLMNQDPPVPTWSVYSPTQDTLTAIDRVWADDAYDIQRSRGAAATRRVSRVRTP